MLAFDKLAIAAKGGPTEYTSAYLPLLKDILTSQTDPRLLRSRFEHKVGIDNGDLIRFSAIFNDVSFVEATTRGEMNIITLEKKGFASYFGGDQLEVTLPMSMAEELGLAGKTEAPLLPGFIFPSGSPSANFLSEVQPLIECKRLVVLPKRTLIVLKGQDSTGRRSWHAHSVDSDSPFDTWSMLEESHSENRPFQILHAGDKAERGEEFVFEMLLPYLRGIAFKDLARVIEDESDLISGLRAAIQEATSKAKPNRTAIELARDVVDPKVDALNRKFRSLVETHSLKMAGAAIGSVALAFTAVAAAGPAAAFATVAGAGGVGLLSKQYADYREQRAKLTEDPYYFLWRCKREGQRK